MGGVFCGLRIRLGGSNHWHSEAPSLDVRLMKSGVAIALLSPQIAASYRGSYFSMVWLWIGVLCGVLVLGAGAGADSWHDMMSSLAR